MKKESKTPKKRQSYEENTNLGDLGLEPPKIYRQSQQKIVEQGRRQPQTQKKDNRQNISRAEKRQKQNKKRRKRNKLRKIITWFTIALVIIVVGVILSLTVFFKIDNIKVTGNNIYTKEQVTSHCDITIGENLFLADTKGSKELLERNLPYIYNAEIKRKFPYTIVINIKETEPAYCIRNKEKQYVYLDDNFKVLENNAKKKKGIVITNADIKTCTAGQQIVFTDKKKAKCLKAIANEIKANKFDEITRIYSKSLVDNYVVYDHRITFKLGNCDNLEAKLYKGYAACDKLNETSPSAKGILNITGDKQIYFTEK